MDHTILLPSTADHTHNDCSCNGTWWRMHLLSIPVPFVPWENVAFEIKSGFNSHKMSWESTMPTLIFQKSQLQKLSQNRSTDYTWCITNGLYSKILGFLWLRMDTSKKQVSGETQLLFWSQSVCKYHAEFLIWAHILVDVSSCRWQTASPAIFCTILTSNFLA